MTTAREYGMRIAKELESFLESLKEQPGKTLTYDLAGKIERTLLEFASQEVEKALREAADKIPEYYGGFKHQVREIVLSLIPKDSQGRK